MDTSRFMHDLRSLSSACAVVFQLCRSQQFFFFREETGKERAKCDYNARVLKPRNDKQKTASKGIFFVCRLMTRGPVLSNYFFHQKRVLELVFELRGNVLKMLHTESTLKRKIVPAAIAVWRNSYRHGNAQGENKEKTRKGEGNKRVFLVGIGIAVMFGQYFSSEVHAAGDDESEKENHRYKGRFSSWQKTPAFNKLAKANLRRPLDEKTTMIETNFEPEKKMTRSRMVSLKNMHIGGKVEL